MGDILKNIIEPIVIITCFTAGTLINRRRVPSEFCHDIEGLEPDGPLRSDIAKVDIAERRRAPNRFFSLISSIFNTFPFLIEIWYWNLTYWVYQLIRAYSARTIAGNEAIFLRARAHALQVLRFESIVGIDWEQCFQSHILAHRSWLMPILGKIYYSHISVGVCFIVYTYTYLPPSLFQRIRRTIAIDNYLALIVVTLWRCYPPRLLPEEYGFVDVLHKDTGGGNAWTNNRFQLTIAAMPSLHFGTALFFAVCLCRFSPHRAVRALAPLWPAAMLVTIVATANHFLMDAIVGAFVPLLGWRINELMLLLYPIQNWYFRPLTRRLDLVKSLELPPQQNFKEFSD